MTTLSDLRAQVIDLSGGICEWPGCDLPGAQMAHFDHRGMGGRTSVNRLGNVAWLCHRHHLLLDREIPLPRWELRELLRFAVAQCRFGAGDE